jgi:uncharacterized protein
MILYLDTSALVKLFVTVALSAIVRAAVATSSVVVTRLLARVEACSAFARLAAGRSEKSLFRRLRHALDMHWPEWKIVHVEEDLVRRAGDPCGRSRLRGYDSVRLAAAERVNGVSGGRTDFRFGVFDESLARASTNLGLTLL